MTQRFVRFVLAIAAVAFLSTPGLTSAQTK